MAELYRIEAGGERIVVERLARDQAPEGAAPWPTDMVRFEVTDVATGDVVASGTVHAPDARDGAAARRVLPAIEGWSALHAALNSSAEA